MTQFILKLKHWQLFVLMIALPSIGAMTIMGSMVSSLLTLDPATPEQFSQIMKSIFIYNLPFSIMATSIQYTWLWAVVKGLQHKIPGDIDLHIKRFNIVFVSTIILLLLLYTLMYIMFSTLFASFPEQSVNPEYFVVFFITFPVNMAMFGCSLYLMYFAAQTLKTVELQHKSGFDKCALEFVLFFFNIVGIWILQPRINKLMEDPQPLSEIQ
ncbi:MAG: hypothetical protein JNJ85_00635 [Candidatus Kapabacteria bacterium]|nr:hypothetical protein [Candidatus Kapabacteria bacterium]